MFINRAELFAELSDPASVLIDTSSVERFFERGEVVFREGESADDFYVLVDGAVQLCVGDEEEMCFLANRAGEIFGWTSLVAPYRYRANAKCISDTTVLEIPRSVIERVAAQYPEDALLLYQHLAAVVTRKLREAFADEISRQDMDEALLGVANSSQVSV
jgi:CRP-like cAMP-binding protein